MPGRCSTVVPSSRFFWDTVTKNHTYANGGNSEAEYFGPPGVLSTRLTEDTSESCNTYNMLKLTQHLFSWEPKARYADYSERALFNHALASTEPGTGMKCYYMPLAGMPKEYSEPFDSFWCCVGTGWENPPRYTDSIYFHDATTLYVNLFIASRLAWKEKAITLTQETRFPEEDVTRLKIRLSEAEWTKRENEQKALEARTVDRLMAGDEASGKAHGLDTASARVGMPMGRPAWELRNDAYGYVYFELDPKGAAKPLELRLSLWSGSEASFAVIVNGGRIGQTELKKDKPLRVKELSYAVPEDLTRGPGTLKVWITPQPGKSGPAVFGAALLHKR